MIKLLSVDYNPLHLVILPEKADLRLSQLLSVPQPDRDEHTSLQPDVYVGLALDVLLSVVEGTFRGQKLAGDPRLASYLQFVESCGVRVDMDPVKAT